MASSRRSTESGFRSGSEISDSDSAMKNFWNSYMPQLELAVGQNLKDDNNFDDPTIDLNHILGNDIAIRPPSPIRHGQMNTNNNGAHVAKRVSNNQINNTFNRKKDPTIEELVFVVGEFKKKSHYGNKLADIMLKGLESTLNGKIYQIFLLGGLPKNWMPIVKMNNDNTPYIEFLIKSEIADEDPESQLNEYTMEHIAYSKFIVDYLYESTKRIEVPTAPISRQFQSYEKSKVTQEKIHINPRQISCSTPISQRKTVPTKRASLPLEVNLNDSKRILPSRACKSNVSGAYRLTK